MTALDPVYTIARPGRGRPGRRQDSCDVRCFKAGGLDRNDRPVHSA